MSARPRVLLVGPLPNEGDVIGGTKVSFAGLVEGLRSRGRVDVEVHDTTRVRRGRGPLRRRLDDALGLASLLLRLLSPHRRPQVVMFNTSSGGALLSTGLVRAACGVWGARLVVRVFGGDLDTFLERAPAPLRRLAQASLYGADLLLLQTRALCSRFSFRARVGWLPTSRDHRPAGERGPKSARRFLFVGQLRPEKGAREAALAARQLPPEASLTIHGPAMPGFDPASLEGSQQVVYGGPIEPELVPGVLADHDVLLFPSYHAGEGMPGILIEALQAGLPVICTRWRALPEVIGHGEQGLLIEPRDVHSLASAMQRVCEDDALFQRLREGALRRGELFRSDLWLERLESWFEELATSGNVVAPARDWIHEEAA